MEDDYYKTYNQPWVIAQYHEKDNAPCDVSESLQKDLVRRDPNITWCYLLKPRLLKWFEGPVLESLVSVYAERDRSYYKSAILMLAQRIMTADRIATADRSAIFDVAAAMERIVYGVKKESITASVVDIAKQVGIYIDGSLAESCLIAKKIKEKNIDFPSEEVIPDVVSFCLQWDSSSTFVETVTRTMFGRREISWYYSVGIVHVCFSRGVQESCMKQFPVGDVMKEKEKFSGVLCGYGYMEALVMNVPYSCARILAFTCKHAYNCFLSRVRGMGYLDKTIYSDDYVMALEDWNSGHRRFSLDLLPCYLHHVPICKKCDIPYTGHLVFPNYRFNSLSDRDLWTLSYLVDNVLVSSERGWYKKNMAYNPSIGLSVAVMLLIVVAFENRTALMIADFQNVVARVEKCNIRNANDKKLIIDLINMDLVGDMIRNVSLRDPRYCLSRRVNARVLGYPWEEYEYSSTIPNRLLSTKVIKRNMKLIRGEENNEEELEPDSGLYPFDS